MYNEAQRLSDTLVDLRRRIHRHPELGFEEHETACGDVDRYDDLEEELIHVVEAPEVIDDAEKECEETARDKDRNDCPVKRTAREQEEKRGYESEEHPTYDSDSAYMGYIPAGPPVRFLADLPPYRDTPDKRRECQTEHER